MQLGELAAADAVFLLRQDDDGAALGRFVGKRSQLRGVGKFLFADAAQRLELGGLAIAKRDRAGLVEQERVDVASGLDRASGGGEHVETHQAVHAGDADGRQQRADRGRDQRHEQCHQHHDGDGIVGVSDVARNGRGREHEDDRQADQKNIERDLVRRLLPFGAFDQLDHAVEKGRAGCRGDAHANPVRQHLRSAGHRRAVAARLANDRRRFAGDGGLVDRGHAFDHFAVGRDQIAGLDQNDVVDLQLGRGNEPIVLQIVPGQELGLRLGALAAQRLRLRLAAAFSDRCGEVGEQHREPQPQDDLKLEADILAAGHEIANQDHRRQGADDLKHEHHRILHQRPGIELDEGRADRGNDNLRIEECRYGPAMAERRRFHCYRSGLIR